MTVEPVHVPVEFVPVEFVTRPPRSPSDPLVLRVTMSPSQRRTHESARRIRAWLLVLAFVSGATLLGSGEAAAQGAATAALQGVVVDSLGVPVGEADVEIRHDPTGAIVRTTTDSAGRFHLANLRPGGPYELTVARIGVAPFERTGIHLQTGVTTRIDVQLGLQAVELPGLEVRVLRAGRFGTARIGAATVVDAEMIGSLPTMTRNLMDFAALSPMAIATDRTVSIAGQNHRYNALQIDGALSQDVFGRSASGMPGGEAEAKPLPLEAVEQYQVVVAPFDVRQSGFTGGLLNAVTRGGTNEWETSAFGFVRNHRLLGDVELDGVMVGTDEFQTGLLGLSVGGPLSRDRLHLFLAAEVERREQPTSGFSQGTADPVRMRLASDSVVRFMSLLEGYGMDPGEAATYPLENPTENLFARLDWRPRDGQRVTFRLNHAGARHDAPANRQAFDPYELSSNGYRVRHRSTGAALEWSTRPTTRLSNELMLNLHRIRDRAEANSVHPRVEVDVLSRFDGGLTLGRRIRAGAAPYAQANELDQSVFQVRNDLTASLGRHVLTVGVSAERFGANSLLLPGAGGTYLFGNLAALEANQPLRYSRHLLLEGVEDPRTRFSLIHLGAYAQDEWRVSDGLTLQLGLRLDRPHLPDSPRANQAVSDQFGLRTDEVPTGGLQVSPRFAFNWQNRAERTTQVRGGVGLFAGRPPLSWLANAYANTGLESAFLVCEGSAAPGLVSHDVPDQCLDGTGVDSGAAPLVTAFADDFRFPQDLRFALGGDQRLTRGLTVTVDAVYTHSLHQFFIEDVNLADPVEDPLHGQGYSDGFGYHARRPFGIPTLDGFEPLRRSEDFGPVLRISDEGRSRALAMTMELEQVFSDRLAFQAAYTYTESLDRQSLTEADAVSNFGVTPAAVDPNDPPLARSIFDRPHKVLLSAWGRLDRLGGTEVSLLYTGQSGRRYSYVYSSDVNADGFPGSGDTLDRWNDLLYVPIAPFDFPGYVVSRSLFFQLRGLEPCLLEAAGSIIERNTCQSPWVNRLDLRVAQGFEVQGREFQLVGDIVNVLNLLNSDWGREERVGPTVSALEVLGREMQGLFPSPTDPLIPGYVGPVRREGPGQVRAARPFHPSLPSSQWQAQFGVRVHF